MTANSGILAGIFGLNGLKGFILYFTMFIIGSFIFYIKT